MFPEDQIRLYLNDLLTANPLPGTEMFADQEAVSGACNGINTTFTLSHTPNPQLSLLLNYNGLTLIQGVDFSVSGGIITFTSFIPQTGDRLEAWYRYTS